MRDMVASICDDVILFASPLVGDWQRPEDPYLQPKAPPEGSKQPAAAEAAVDVGDDDRPRTAVGPAVLTRAGCVLAAAGCLARGGALHVELAGHDREDLPQHLEKRLIELIMASTPRADGLQIDQPSDRAYLEQALNAHHQGGTAALSLVQTALRNWLSSEAALLMRSLRQPRPTLPLPMRESLARLFASSGQPGDAEALLVLEATLREQALGRQHPDALPSPRSQGFATQGQLDEDTNLYSTLFRVHIRSGNESPLTLRTMVTCRVVSRADATDEAASSIARHDRLEKRLDRAIRRPYRQRII